MNLAQIEILYVVMFAIISLFTILAYTEKMSIGIAILSILVGLAISWIFAPYMNMVITPMGNFILYGYSLSLSVITSFYHFFSMVFIIMVAGYNQIVSEGKITWA